MVAESALIPGKNVTIRQETFAIEYVRLGIRTKAAINAGFSPKTAASIGCQLTDPDKNPHVVALIERLLTEKRAKFASDGEKIEQALGRIAYLDPAEMYDEEGNLLPLRDMPEEVRKAIGRQKIVTREMTDDDGNIISTTKLIDVEAESKQSALRLLADMKGLTRSGSTVNNFNVANSNADATAAVALTWDSLREKSAARLDPVAARLEEARRLAESKLGQVAEANGVHETNGHVAAGEGE